jgi:hypothetical protein
VADLGVLDPVAGLAIELVERNLLGLSVSDFDFCFCAIPALSSNPRIIPRPGIRICTDKYGTVRTKLNGLARNVT